MTLLREMQRNFPPGVQLSFCLLNEREYNTCLDQREEKEKFVYWFLNSILSFLALQRNVICYSRFFFVVCCWRRYTRKLYLVSRVEHSSFLCVSHVFPVVSFSCWQTNKVCIHVYLFEEEKRILTKKKEKSPYLFMSVCMFTWKRIYKRKWQDADSAHNQKLSMQKQAGIK